MPGASFGMALEPYGSILEDRATVLDIAGARIIAVADGAGGISHGDRAAEAVIHRLELFLGRGLPPGREQTWTGFLDECDHAIRQTPDCGQTTAVVLAVLPGTICGASVGDSEAWLVTAQAVHPLTSGQRRKPFLGSGCVTPVPFRTRFEGGRLLVGTDGLFKYADRNRIQQVVSMATPEMACRALIDLVRLPSGKLQDDVGVVVLDLASND